MNKKEALDEKLRKIKQMRKVLLKKKYDMIYKKIDNEIKENFKNKI